MEAWPLTTRPTSPAPAPSRLSTLWSPGRDPTVLVTRGHLLVPLPATLTWAPFLRLNWSRWFDLWESPVSKPALGQGTARGFPAQSYGDISRSIYRSWQIFCKVEVLATFHYM